MRIRRQERREWRENRLAGGVEHAAPRCDARE
jgi:hypothetical protein